MQATRILVSLLAAGLATSCGGGGGSPTPTPTPTLGPVDFADAMCEWQDALLAGVGNPDLGQESEAWQALEAALESSDEEAIRSAASTVVEHLDTGAEWARRMTAFPGAEQGGSELVALMEGLASGVAGLRDGTIADDSAMVEEARASIEEAYSHFWPGLQALMEPVSEAGGVDGTPCKTDPIPET